MKNFADIHGQAMSSLLKRSPYSSFSRLKMDVIEHVLLTLLIENQHSKEIVTPTDLLFMRLAFLDICERGMVKLLVNYQKELFKGKRFRKHIPETLLQLNAIGKTGLVSHEILRHRNTIFDSIRKLSPQSSNSIQLQQIFTKRGEAIPASMSFEQMLREYPWLVADCVEWSEIFPPG